MTLELTTISHEITPSFLLVFNGRDQWWNDSILPDISTFHERAGEPQSSRWPGKSWRPSSSVWSTWCLWTSLVTSCSTTAQFRTLKKQWVDQGGCQCPRGCFAHPIRRFHRVFFLFFLFSLPASNLARAVSTLCRSWRGPCSSWACMTRPCVMWRTSPPTRYRWRPRRSARSPFMFSVPLPPKADNSWLTDWPGIREQPVIHRCLHLPPHMSKYVVVAGERVQERRPGLECHRGLHRVSPWACPQSHQSTVRHRTDTTLQPAASSFAGMMAPGLPFGWGCMKVLFARHNRAQRRKLFSQNCRNVRVLVSSFGDILRLASTFNQEFKFIFNETGKM